MIQKYEDLNDIQLDVLKEIGNIGSGNASTQLSAMTGINIEIKMPEVKVLGFQEAIEENGSPDETVAGILVRMKDDISGIILLLIEKEFSDIISGVFFGRDNTPLLELDENQRSALSEVGNIMASAYVGAISGLSGLRIGLQAPAFTVDMLGSVMSVPVIEFGEVGEKLLCITKTMVINGKQIKSNMLLIPTVDSLSLLFARLGVK